MRVKFATPCHCEDLPLILSPSKDHPEPVEPRGNPVPCLTPKSCLSCPSMQNGRPPLPRWERAGVRVKSATPKNPIHPAYPVHPCWIRLPSPTGRGAGGEGRTPDDSPPLSLRGAQPLMVSLSNHVAIPSKQRRRFLLGSPYLIIWYNRQRNPWPGRNCPSCVTALTMRTPAAP